MIPPDLLAVIPGGMYRYRRKFRLSKPPALAVMAGGAEPDWWPGRAFGVSGLAGTHPGACFVNYAAVKDSPPGARGDAPIEDALAAIPVRRNQP